MITIPIRVTISAGFALTAVLLVVAALCSGEPELTPAQAWTALAASTDPAHVSVFQARLPRALLALTVGAGLGAAGLLMQDVLRNPIAGPELLGVSSGAAVVMAVVTVLGLGLAPATQTLFAFVGAVVAGGLVLASVGRVGDPDSVVLVGAAVSAACAGLVVAVVGLGTQGNVIVLFRYLLGSLAARGWPTLETAAPVMAACLLATWLLRRRVQALTLGDDVATGLGVPVRTTRIAALTVSALIAAAAAAACGPIAFIALLAPHIARALLGTSRTEAVAPVAVAIGANLLLAADLVSRTALRPVELPVGIATTLVGIPILVMLRRRWQVAA